MADRWFIVPPIVDPDNPRRRVPKYASEFGITGLTGTIMDFSDEKWSDVPWYPNEMYVVKFYASRNKELNDVEKQDDVWSERGTSQQQIASYLNDRTRHAYTFSEWTARFAVGGSV